MKSQFISYLADSLNTFQYSFFGQFDNPALDIFLGVVDMSGAKQLVIPKIGLVDGIIRHMWLNADSLEDRACPVLAH